MCAQSLALGIAACVCVCVSFKWCYFWQKGHEAIKIKTSTPFNTQNASTRKRESVWETGFENMLDNHCSVYSSITTMSDMKLLKWFQQITNWLFCFIWQLYKRKIKIFAFRQLRFFLDKKNTHTQRPGQSSTDSINQRWLASREEEEKETRRVIPLVIFN